ncbi:ferritin family protein [Planctomycetota bacterium]
MDKSDSLDEVLEYAIDREIDANQFYLALAERVDNVEMRKVFEDLADEELEHKAKLELELMKLGKTTAIKVPPTSPQRDYIISDSNSLLDMDYKDMLMMAIEKEEASFRTYVNLVPRAYDSESREVLLSLAEEEVRHKLRFQTEYDIIMKHK